MITKAELKDFAKLHHKRNIDKEGKILVEGEKMILEALSSAWECELILKSSAFELGESLMVQSINKKIPVETIQRKELERLADTVTPQDYIAVFKVKRNYMPSTQGKKKLSLIMDSIADPGNLGTIVRTADWFGVREIVLTGSTADYLNAKVIRASMGSVFRMYFRRCTTTEQIKQYISESGRKLVCADLTGSPIQHFNSNNEYIALLLGNEANGPSEELKQLASESVLIPGKGDAESLNVSAAAAILIYELTENSSH